MKIINNIKKFWVEHSYKKGFFLPTVGIYVVISLTYITIQSLNVLSLQYALNVKEENLYFESALAKVKYEVEKHESSIIDANTCLLPNDEMLTQDYYGYKINVSAQCHKVPQNNQLDELTKYYADLKIKIKASNLKLNNAQYLALEKKLDIINDLELVEDVEDGEEFINEIVITGGEAIGFAIIEYSVDELKEMTFEDWIVYDIEIKENKIDFKEMVFYNNNSKKTKKIIYTLNKSA